MLQNRTRTFPPRKPGAVSQYRLSLLPPLSPACLRRPSPCPSLFVVCHPCISDSLSPACLHRFRLFVLAERCTTTNYPVVCFLPPVRGSICGAAPKRLALIWSVHIASQEIIMGRRKELFFFSSRFCAAHWKVNRELVWRPHCGMLHCLRARRQCWCTETVLVHGDNAPALCRRVGCERYILH